MSLRSPKLFISSTFVLRYDDKYNDYDHRTNSLEDRHTKEMNREIKINK